MDKKEKKEIKVNGHAKFKEGHLIPPTVKKKTAEELLKENPIKGKLKREINEIEEKQKNKKAPKQKEIKASTVVEKLCKCNHITSHYNGYDNVIKCNGKTICWVSDRKYGVALSTWGTGQKNWTTNRITTQKEMYDAIGMIKERFVNGEINKGS